MANKLNAPGAEGPRLLPVPGEVFCEIEAIAHLARLQHQSHDLVAEPIRRWKHLEAYTRADMDEILVAKLIATSARQIFMFLVILAVVSAAMCSSERLPMPVDEKLKRPGSRRIASTASSMNGFHARMPT